MHEHFSAGARRLGIAAGAAALMAFGLASVSPAGAATSASVADHTLTIKGSAASERLALRLAPGASGTLQVDFGDDGTADASFDRATFSQIRVTLRSGDDAFRVDQVNGAFADEALTVEGEDGNDTFAGGDGSEHYFGGAGDDAVDGNRGDDVAELGSGRDSFRWDPGDGSDTIYGQTGNDTLDFNGAGANENMSLSPNGSRSLFLRDVANIRMDMDNVESLDLTALGGTDTFTVDDMSGTDFKLANVDLQGPVGGGDGAIDTVVVNGTEAADAINVAPGGIGVQVGGLKTTTGIGGSEPTDVLVVNGLGGTDTITVDPATNALIGVVANQ
jgi:RTX calcium-binding nonapeptide repeat (4 copies)